MTGGIKDPIGVSGVRLGGSAHHHRSTTSIQNGSSPQNRGLPALLDIIFPAAGVVRGGAQPNERPAWPP